MVLPNIGVHTALKEANFVPLRGNAVLLKHTLCSLAGQLSRNEKITLWP